MMRIKYTGQFTVANGHTYRLAEMFFDEVDEPIALRVINLLRIKGWDIDSSIAGWASCEVANRDEYKEFVQDWKESKHCIIQCMKYGF